MAEKKAKKSKTKTKPKAKAKSKPKAKSRAKARARPKRVAGRTAALVAAATVDRILDIAARSAIARFRWPSRGVAPAGYIKGMAVVYARVYCKLRAGDPFAVEMAKAKAQSTSRDALSWYDDEFRALGMRNDSAGADTLRHLFVLLIGLGMRESSGKHCEGRDRSASNTSAETAEAGLFQTSFNARSGSPLLPRLFAQYLENPSGFVEIFREGVRCTAANLENFGSGQGRDFQRLSKECPAFAAEFAAVGLRNVRKHWGPITDREAELRREADTMLREVQDAIDASPGLCAALL
jgi:hypothetical protein